MDFSSIKMPTRKKGQGAFEYILLLAGILLIVVLVIVILKSGLTQQASSGITGTSGKISANIQIKCLDFCGDGAWEWIHNQNNSIVASYAPGVCNLSAGFEGRANCFWNSSVTDTVCLSQNNLYYPDISGSSLDSLSIHTYDNLSPNNIKFCQLVQNG